MGAKFCTVKTELILLGLAAAFLGVLLGISAGDRAAAEPVSVSAERALPPEGHQRWLQKVLLCFCNIRKRLR